MIKGIGLVSCHIRVDDLLFRNGEGLLLLWATKSAIHASIRYWLLRICPSYEYLCQRNQRSLGFASAHCGWAIITIRLDQAYQFAFIKVDKKDGSAAGKRSSHYY